MSASFSKNQVMLPDEGSILLKAARPDLYRLNAFRVTEMPVDASPAEMARRIRLIQSAAIVGISAQPGRGRALSMDHTLDPDSVADAVRSLDDPERRLIDELFWFWPHQLGNSRDDDALQALAAGDNARAAAIWQRQESYQSEASVSNHNQAVLYHATALDLEYASQKRSLSPEERAERDNAWAQTHRRWKELLGQDGFWDRSAGRIREIDDARLTTGMARRLRSALPQALLAIHAQLAIRAAGAKNAAEVTRQITLMKQSGFPQTTIDDALRQAVDPVSTQIKTLCSAADKAAVADAAHANQTARRLLDQAKPLLAELDMLLPSIDLQRGAMHDRVAECVLQTVIIFANPTEDWDAALPLVREALTIAVGEPMRKRLDESLQQLLKNIEDRIKTREEEKLQSLCWFCQQRKPDASVGIPIKLYGDVTHVPAWNGTQVKWRQATVDIPRCGYCKDIHNNSDRLYNYFAFGCLVPLIGIPLFLSLLVANAPGLGEYWVLLLGAAIIAGLIAMVFGKMRLKSDKNVKPLTAQFDYPRIKALKAQGWALGEKPAGVQ